MDQPDNHANAAMPIPPPGFRLIIVLQPDGEIWVQGPLANKPLCKAILAGAERKIEDFDLPNRSVNLVVPSLVPPRDLRPA